MEYTYKITRDIYRDAWNWWNGCNSIGHGVDWKETVDPEIVKKIHGKSRKEAYVFLIPLLKKRYKSNKNTFKKSKKFISDQFEKKFEKGCKKLVKVMGKPLYRRNFHFYLTTFDRAPYDKKKGEIWLPVSWTDPMSIFLHELCHFQFIHYWRENPKSDIAKLSSEQFEFLKESLTIILNKDFLRIINKPDKGYELHKKLRKKLLLFWKKEKDFNKLVKFGTKKITKYI